MKDENLPVTRRDVMALAGGLAALNAVASVAAAAVPSGQWPCHLYPHESSTRASRDLSGVWQFRLDPNDEGEAANWPLGLTQTRPIAVPASWNDLFDDARNYFGAGWYQTEFFIDAAWRGRRMHLRFGSANYRAKVWLNGKLLGEHVGGHLPFVFDISAFAQLQVVNRLVVMVENKLQVDRVPAATNPGAGISFGGYPAVTFDFFPYAGLHRPVWLFATPSQFVDDVTVRTTLAGDSGIVAVDISVSGNWSGTATIVIEDGARRYAAKTVVRAGRARAQVTIPSVRAWHPDDPFLYNLVVRLGADLIDEYRLKIGVRTIEVNGEQLLLNGKPIFLTGFGKHEDFPIHGRGLDVPVIVRDFELLKWIGANSFRTSHYPYSDEAMQLADEYGLLVIDETPAVSLGLGDAADIIEARREQLNRALAELIQRDKNHPCVIAWSIANEPGIVVGGGATAERPAALVEAGTRFFKPLFDYARNTDPTRLVVLVSVGNGPDEWVGMGDIICTNLYYGWYYGGLGQLEDVAQQALAKEIQRLRTRHGKPIMLTEFGADTLPGKHAQPPEMWSEEYQAQMMEVYMRTLRQHAYVVGAHPWTFADFKTSQGILRAAGLNHKGVFTREREPKLAAHTLRTLWRGK